MAVSLSTTFFVTSGAFSIPLEGALEQTAAGGFEQIEISRKHPLTPDAHDKVAAAGLKVWAIHGTLDDNVLREDSAQSAITAETARMELAAPFAPCPYVVHYLDRTNGNRDTAAFRRGMEQLLTKAEELQLIVAVETVPYKPQQNERYADSGEVAAFARSFDSPFMQVCIDLNHSNLNEELPDAAANCSGLISTIHVSDNHGIREEHSLPGDGIIDFSQAFKALGEHGYTGPINLEPHIGHEPTQADIKRLYEWACSMEQYLNKQ